MKVTPEASMKSDGKLGNKGKNTTIKLKSNDMALAIVNLVFLVQNQSRLSEKKPEPRQLDA